MRVGVPDFGFRTGGDSGTFVFGDVITFSCSPGYLRVGPTELICRGDGQFSGSAPSCESNLGSLNLVRYRALFLASFGEEAGMSQTAYEQADVNKNGLVSEARRKKDTLSYFRCKLTRGFFIGHRRYVKDGHWIDAGFLIGKRQHTHQKR